MVEEKQKYNFKEFILSLTAYMNENDLNSTDTIKFNQILFKLQNIDAIVENVDEDLLESIKNYYESTNTYCRNIMAGNMSYLSNLSTTLDSILQTLIKYINYSLIFNNKSNIKLYIRNYKSEISKQKNTLESETKDILNYIADKKQNIEKDDSDLNSKIKELENELENLKSKQERINTDSNNIINQSMTTNNKFIEDSKNKLDELYNNSEKELIDKFDKLSIEYQSKFEELLKAVEQKDKKISELISIVGEKARIGEYKKNADSSHKERMIWQYITIALFLIAFIVMIIVTFTSKDYDKYTIIKYIVSALLMGAATYTAKQASNSRKDEIYFRKQELELASIDIYLENMQDANREEIKKTLATKMFGQAQSTYTNKYDEKKGFSTDDFTKIVESLKSLLK